jgi:hypothetical protein
MDWTFDKKEKKPTESKKKKAKSFISLEGDNSRYALILLSVFLIIGGIWLYQKQSSDETQIKDSIGIVQAEKTSLTKFMSADQRATVTDKFPLFSNVSRDFLKKKDVETAEELRAIANNHQVSISGYQTQESEITYKPSASKNSGSADIILKQRKADFVIGGSYDNCIAFLKDIEKMKRLVEVTDIIFAGARLSTTSNQQTANQPAFFVKYDKLNSMRVSIAYYYLDSSMKVQAGTK